MVRIIRSACVACGFLGWVAATTVPAGAAVLFSLSGTVGDSNWGSASYTEPNYELALDLAPYFERGGGPGGKLVITYDGAPILASFDTLYNYSSYEEYICLESPGCADRSAFTHIGGDETITTKARPAPDGATSYTDIVQSSFRFTPGSPPPDAPYESLFEDRWSGNVDLMIDDLVSTDYAGRAFSITVSTVPEPASWALMIAGFGLAGFMLRRRQPVGSRA